SGHAATTPPISRMKSRRRMLAPRLGNSADDDCQRCDYSKDLQPAKWASLINLHCKNLDPWMSLTGHERLFGALQNSSAFPFKTDLDGSSAIARFVPGADSCSAAKHRRGRQVLFDHLVGASMAKGLFRCLITNLR